MEPEVTSMLYSPVYNDQLWVAKQFAKSLPVGYKLYVKEHLAMYGYRTRAFYRELKKIPNVRLIPPTMESYPLIRNAELITTITSTVGWEAIAFEKPIITLGDVFFNELPFVAHCTAMADLPNLVRSQLTSFKYSEEALVTFIANIMQQSVTVDLSDIWEKERSSRVSERREELAPLADLIYAKIRPHTTHDIHSTNASHV